MSWFALATYRAGKTEAPAIVVDNKLYDARQALPNGIAGAIADWSKAHAAVRHLGEQARAGKLAVVAEGAKALTAPIRPTRIFCAASNYIEHAKEMGSVLAAKAQSKPYMFLKLQDTVVGPGDDVVKPPETTKLDWEVELGAIIGRQARRIGVGEALDYVAGYTVVNDISARDLNTRTDYPFKFDWFQGKSWDSFAPLGPWIVPAWLIPDPQALGLRLTVNGEEMQKDSTKNMIWNVREQISYLSQILTLRPGDVIATGTPTGVGMGRGIFLKHGDQVEATVENIGTLSNRVVDEKR
ncbi:MAG TPA: fumarylacetoacetate hydrolase family protein [Burkholderiales bacterium]|jgi:2,4-diketo-3-deoxy-L-fuconate hydrolase|nr:fumarylacetoacetate hydrolase family protein [Burkholderiales bacterium]